MLSPCTGPSLVRAGGTPLQVSGQAKINLTVLGTPSQTEILVVNSLMIAAILELRIP